MIELALVALAGIAAGIVTGVVPGIHVNAVSLLVVASAGALGPLPAAVFLVSIAITHTFWDFVPSILLGAPSEDTALGVLPGHQLLLQGRGAEAVALTVAGGVVAVLLALPALPLLLVGLPVLYALAKPLIPLLLAAIGGFMALIEPSWKRRAAGLALFLFSGAFGLIVLDAPLLAAGAALFPVFTGLFGTSTLLLSMRERTCMPQQSRAPVRLERRLVLGGAMKGLLSGALMGTLPALGAAQATVLTQHLSRRGQQDPREFLMSNGAINTIVSLFSLVSLYTIAKPRSGAAVAVQELLGTVGAPELLLLVAVSVLAAGVSGALLVRAAPALVQRFQRVPYGLVTKGVLCLLVLLVGALSGPLGLAVLAVATAIGLLAPLWNVKRSLLMGVLMLPLILSGLGI